MAVSSLGFSFAFSTLPFLKGAGIRVLSSNKTIRDIDARQKKIFEAQKAYNAVGDKRTREARAYKRTLTELQLQQQQAVKKAERSASNGITLNGAAMLSRANRQINEARLIGSPM